MSLEHYHRELKYHGGIMNGKKNQRIDTLIQQLFRYEDLMRQRVLCTSADGGVNDSKTRLNFLAHQEAFGQSFDIVTPMDDGWCIQSFENPGVVYKVKPTMLSCCFDTCLQMCKECFVCWHEYRCNCPAAINVNNRSHSCKHAHLVMMNRSSYEQPSITSDCSDGSFVPSACNVLPSTVMTPDLGIGQEFLSGRSNTDQIKQCRNVKAFHCVSKQKSKKSKKEFLNFDCVQKQTETNRLMRNAPQACELLGLLAM
ncbi:unnamed protein product [Meganyctiphanes norvegica]|uniref:SWIM-type domain-containing protein n=1 Tax=Meganyctiphanes norvegica TaxID=48144 RepID=A0AAV2QTQ2_MEGNR